MKIQVQIMINRDIKTVWDAFTNPIHLVNWNFASDDWCCPKASNDLKVWWKMCSTMSAKDNSMSFDFEWEYTNIIQNKLIEYTILDMQYWDKYLEKWRKVSVSFEEKDDFVILTETFDAEDIHSLDLQKAWWQAILENFKKYTESL